MLCWRRISAIGTLASPCFRISTIWLSVNRDFRMGISLAPESLRSKCLPKGEAYKPRRVAERCRPPIQLSREFWKRALGARWHAKVAERDRSHPDSSLREEWRKVARHYPRLARVPLGRRLVSKWRAMCDDAQSWVVGQKATIR